MRLRKDLRRANQLSETGDHANAAIIFTRLAREAHDRGFLKHAPHLYQQAAYAHLLDGQTEQGVATLRVGLDILANSSRWPALHQTGDRAIKLLREMGHEKDAQKIEAWLSQTLPERPSATSRASKESGRLPVKCPYCGASPHPNEINWLNREAAQCAYCGSTIVTSA